MLNLKKFLILLIIVLIAIVFINNNNFKYKEGTFVINEGQTLKIISQNLKNEGFIRNSHLFYFILYFEKNPKDIKAGTYKLNSTMSYSEIIEQIINGNTLNEKITVLEGWTIDDIANYLEEKNLFKKEDFLKITGKPGLNYPCLDFSNEFSFLKEKPKNMSLEGFLFPDTYYISKDDTPETIVRKMLSNFEQKVKINTNIFDTIILASIVEKEVRSFEDKQMVTDVILKRLESNIAIRIDATVIYSNKIENNDKLLDLETDSPYNTYQYTGLPIGPISNPGIESIKAVLNPINNDYWYYLSTKNGTTIFSKNFEEHKKNIGIYLR